jgi:hypothetical protein
MKTIINGHEIECSIEEFKHFVNINKEILKKPKLKKVRVLNVNKGKRYTPEELINIKNYIKQGFSNQKISKILNRTKDSIGSIRYGLSKKDYAIESRINLFLLNKKSNTQETQTTINENKIDNKKRLTVLNYKREKGYLYYLKDGNDGILEVWQTKMIVGSKPRYKLIEDNQ